MVRSRLPAATWQRSAFANAINASRSFTFILHQAYPPIAKTPIECPGGAEAAFDFRAAYNSVAGRMMAATPRNQQAGALHGDGSERTATIRCFPG